MLHILLIVLVLVPVGFVYASLFEWVFHGRIMHRDLGLLTYPHSTHTHHHKLFTYDDYHLQRKTDETKIAMAWWNGPILICIGSMPFWLAALLFALFSEYMMAGAIGFSGVFVSASYYGAYEYLHWCMHAPRNRFVERTRVFIWIKEHHRLHHRRWKKNLNVVLPLGDLFFGTLIREK